MVLVFGAIFGGILFEVGKKQLIMWVEISTILIPPLLAKSHGAGPVQPRRRGHRRLVVDDWLVASGRLVQASWLRKRLADERMTIAVVLLMMKWPAGERLTASGWMTCDGWKTTLLARDK